MWGAFQAGHKGEEATGLGAPQASDPAPGRGEQGPPWGACGQSPVGLWGRRRGQVGGGRPSAKGQQWSEGALTALPKRTVALTKFPRSGCRLSEQVQKAGTLGTPRQRAL